MSWIWNVISYNTMEMYQNVDNVQRYHIVGLFHGNNFPHE